MYGSFIPSFKMAAFGDFEEIEQVEDVDILKLLDVLGLVIPKAQNPAFRVRQVIPHLSNTDWLIDQDIIYDLTEFNLNQIKRYPPWLYKEVGDFLDTGNKGKTNSFTSFGLFVEVLVKRALYEQDPSIDWKFDTDGIDIESFKDPQTPLYDIYRHIVKVRTGKDIAQVLSAANFNKSKNYFTAIIKGARDTFSDFVNSKMEFNAEIKTFKINPKTKTKLEWSGHPDIIGEDYVIDIKCVTNFNTQAMEHYLQERLKNIINSSSLLLVAKKI